MTGAASPTRVGTAQSFLMLIGSGEIDQASLLLAAGVSYHVPGHHALAGTFSGPEAVREHLNKLNARTWGSLNAIKWDDWLVGEDHVAALADISMRSGGQLFTGRILFLVKFDRAGDIVAITVFFEDEASAMRFFGPPAEPEDPR
ncbi:MAG TPA: hypothetical protein VEH29_01440 [Acidimicrobiales bacterium]|nr:hypothetical protein [Acidimicrobiales bacterium]